MGTISHLVMESLKLAADIDIVHVPYRGAAPALNDLYAGMVQGMFTSTASAAPMIASGKLRPLAVTTPARSALLPDVPTMAEAGIPDQEAETINGLLAPAGTPDDIVGRINRDTIAALASPDVKERLSALGFEPASSTPAEFGARIRQEIAKWDKVVRAANIRIE